MKPVIAISIGDPGGIGPEVTLKAVARPEIKELLTPLIVGDEKILRELAQAEYRWIEQFGAGVRANMPWWAASTCASGRRRIRGSIGSCRRL